MSVTFCTICSTSGDENEDKTILSQLEKILPSEFQHNLCSHERLVGSHFKCTLRLMLTTKEEVTRWLRSFSLVSYMTWRVLKTYPDSGRFNSYRVDLRCQHFTPPKAGTVIKRSSKDTLCPARMFLVLKRMQTSRKRKSRSKDKHIGSGLSFIVKLSNQHNHDLLGAASLRKRDVSKETADTLKELYLMGHTPKTALDVLKRNLQQELGEKYDNVIADRSVCPDIQFCYRLFNNMARKTLDDPSDKTMVECLEQRLASYNGEHSEVYARLSTTPNGGVAIAICTPLMKLAHDALGSDAETLYVNSTCPGGNDSRDCSVFVLLANSVAGGLPLGVVITTGDCSPALTAGLELLKTLMPETKAHAGCEVGDFPTIVTADHLPLMQALRTAYPGARIRLHTMHMPRSAWSWLWCDENEIASPDRPLLFEQVSLLIGEVAKPSASDESLDATYDGIVHCDEVRKYSHFQEFLREIYHNREVWAVCALDSLAICNATDDMAAVARTVFADKILFRMKSYGLSYLLDFIFRRMDGCYTRRIADLLRKGTDGWMNSRYFLQGRNLDRKSIVQNDEYHYTVTHTLSRQEYLVNLDLGVCTCPIGLKYGPCRHQHAVVRRFKTPGLKNGQTLTVEQKSMLEAIVNGYNSEAELESDPSSVISQVLSHATNILDIKQVHEDEEPPVHEPLSPPACSPDGTPDLDLGQRLQDTFNDLLLKTQQNPAVYGSALNSFICNYANIGTESGLVLALQMFGVGEESALKRQKLD